MTLIEIWVLYNDTNGMTYITKGKRYASQYAISINKSLKYLNVKEYYTCHSAKEHFEQHPVNKELIHFTWDATLSEKLSLIRQFNKYREDYLKIMKGNISDET